MGLEEQRQKHPAGQGSCVWDSASHCVSTAACSNPGTWGTALLGQAGGAGSTAPMGCDRMSPRELCSEAKPAAGEVHSSPSPLPARCLPIPTVLDWEASSSGLLGQEQGNHRESQDGAWVSWCRPQAVVPFGFLHPQSTCHSLLFYCSPPVLPVPSPAPVPYLPTPCSRSGQPCSCSRKSGALGLLGFLSLKKHSRIMPVGISAADNF